MKLCRNGEIYYKNMDEWTCLVKMVTKKMMVLKDQVGQGDQENEKKVEWVGVKTFGLKTKKIGWNFYRNISCKNVSVINIISVQNNLIFTVNATMCDMSLRDITIEEFMSLWSLY